MLARHSRSPTAIQPQIESPEAVNIFCLKETQLFPESKVFRIARLVYPEPTWKHALSRLKYRARAALTPRAALAWSALLERPRLAGLVRRCPHTYCKLQRPYLHRRLKTAGRLAALEANYRFVEERLVGTVWDGIMNENRGHCLAVLPLHECGHYNVRILYQESLSKEGDLSIGLMDETLAIPAFALTFCVWRDGMEGREIFIGGLQGRKRANEKGEVVALTRAMHGLRPKALLLFTLQQLAQEWDIPPIRAVSDETHMYWHARYAARNKNLAASYDEFWAESGGVVDAEGFFRLPVVPVRKDLTELKASKRQLYRRCYPMLDELAQSTRVSMLGSGR